MRGDFDEDEYDDNGFPFEFGQMTQPKTPKALDAITDTVLAYRPKARSKPAVQRKRRKTILEKKRAAEQK